MKTKTVLIIVFTITLVSCSPTVITAPAKTVAPIATFTPISTISPVSTLPSTLTPIPTSTQEQVTPTALYQPIELSPADDETYQKALSDIPIYRQGDIQIVLQDENGNPLSGYLAKYHQISHDFLFGGTSDIYYLSALQQAGINTWTAYMAWDWIQLEYGKFDLDFTNYWLGIDELSSGNIYVKTNNLFNVSEEGMAPYFRDVSYDEFSRRLYEHVSTTVKRFAPSVDYWEAVLEPSFIHQNPLNLSREEYYQAIATSIQAIRDNDPKATVEISLSYPCNVDWINYLLIVQEMLDRKIDFDVLGLQFYYNAYIGAGNYQMPKMSFNEMSACYDKYEKMLTPYGKKIVGSEFSVPSEAPSGQFGYWDIPWSDDTQAQYLATAFTIFFSKPSNLGLVWWNTFEPSPFVFNGGLIREDGTPKISFYTLQRLIEGWTTTGEGITDNNGFITFPGFGGDYDLEIVNPDNGDSMVTQVHINEQVTTSETIKFVPNNLLEEKKADLEQLVAYWELQSEQLRVQKGKNYMALVEHHFLNSEWELAEQTLAAAFEELGITAEFVIPNKQLIPVGYQGEGYTIENGIFLIWGSTTLHYPYTFPPGTVTVEIKAHAKNEKGESPIMVAGVGANYSQVWKVDNTQSEVYSYSVATSGNERDFTIRFPYDGRIYEQINAQFGDVGELKLYIDQVKFIIKTSKVP